MSQSSSEVVVVTGMSGAGRSTVAHAMEDLGWYVVDNLPPALLANLCEMAATSVSSIAVVIDVRGRQFFDDLNRALTALAEEGIAHRVLLLMHRMMFWCVDSNLQGAPIRFRAGIALSMELPKSESGCAKLDQLQILLLILRPLIFINSSRK